VTSTRVRVLGLAAAAFLFGTAGGHAADDPAPDYPSRTVRIVVGFAAGGGNDIIARLIGERLSDILGKPVVVENKPGAGGAIAAEAVKNAAPDGQTLLVAPSGSMVFNPATYRKLSYSPPRDFAPVSMIATFPLIMVVSEASKIKSLEELVAFAKANPSKANFSGTSAAFQLTGELFKMRTGAPFEYVAYKSSTESIDAVVNEGITMTFVDPGPAAVPLRDHKIRALAVTSGKRSPELPDVPTLAELGVAGIDVSLWSALFAPAGTPAPIVQKLNAAVKAALGDAKIHERFKTLGMFPDPGTPEALHQRIVDEIKQWTEVANKANVHLD
jgi:tripartite-type tricarboxylate transporter receptor subunit TctC